MPTTRDDSSSGLWRDRKVRPGWLPNTKLAPLIFIIAIAGGQATKLLPPVAMAILVVAVGLSAFWVAFRLTPERLGQQRYTRGPGWFIGLGISKLSLGAARAIWILMGIGITALGVFALATA